MKKNKEKMIALGMCAVLIASSLNLGGAYGNAFQVQAAELGLSEEASEESENAKATEISQKPENGEMAELTEKSGDTQLPKPQSQPTAQEGEPEEPEDAMPEGASQLQEVAAPEELSGNSDGVEQEDISQVLEDAAANGNSQLLENETAGEPAGEELLESEGMAQDGFLAPAGLETKDGIEPFAETDGSIAIDETNFPDAYFREYLLGTLSGYEYSGADTDGDGMLSEEERNYVESISIYGKAVRDFTGISYFPNLKEFTVGESLAVSVDLSGNEKLVSINMCNNKKLLSVDLSGDAMLESVELGNNENLESVNFDGCNQLTSLSLEGCAITDLDLNGCTQLSYLNCGNNQLTSLDLSFAEQLNSLYVSGNQLVELNLKNTSHLINLQCSGNQLTALDMQSNQKLVSLECGGNRLDTLDVTGMPELEVLDCSGNNLVELDVTKNLSLLRIDCYGNPLTKLDISKNKKLEGLNINFTRITALDATANEQLRMDYSNEYWDTDYITATVEEMEDGRWLFDMTSQEGFQPEKLTISNQCKVYPTEWDAEPNEPELTGYGVVWVRNPLESGNNYFTLNYDLSNNAYLDGKVLRCNYVLEETLEGQMVALTPENFPSAELLAYLQENYDTDGDGQLNTAEVTTLSFYESTRIASLEGIEKLNCLKSLYLWRAPMRRLDLSSNAAINSLQIVDGSLTDIDITGCPNLRDINLSNNSLTSLDLSQNTALCKLDVSGNSIISLDISKNKELQSLDVSSNSISFLDLSDNAKLEIFSCCYNPAMTGLNLSNNFKLKDINCSYNTGMVSLDFPIQKGEISTLRIVGNNIQNLQVNGMPSLTMLEIDSNLGKIEEVDLTGSTKLKSIRACDISVKADWPKMTDLEWIEIQNMQMSGSNSASYTSETIEATIEDGSVSDIPLKKMDLSNATNLERCQVSMNSLGELDVHGCTNLLGLFVGGGRLHTLNIAGCTTLFYLDCSGNQLQSLDVSSCVALKSISCNENQLEELNIESNKALQDLYCRDNKLSAIDTSQNAALKWFECSGNPIVSLDLSNNKAMLSTLNCNNASLTSLDVGGNMALESVSLGNQVFKVSESDLQPETNVAKAASFSTVQPSVPQNLRGASTGRYILRLDKYGNFDPSKVKNLTSGTAVANGIMWESKDAIPDVVGYDYDISNQYKLAGQVMPVQIVFKEGEYSGPNGEIPIQWPGIHLSTCTITLNTKSSSYTGRTQTPNVVVKDRGYTLKPGTDYILNYKNNINAGNASIILKGTGNYTGDVRRNFTIKKAQQKIRCTKSFQKTYGSKAFPLKAKRASGNGRLSYSTSDKKVATVSKNGKVTLKGTGIATITIKAAATKNYKAASTQVKVTVKPAKVAVTSLKTMKGKKLSVKWKKAPNATGYEIQYSTDKKFKKGVKQIKIAKGKATSCTLKKLKDNKKYYVRIRAYKAVKVKGKKQTLKGAWGTVRGSKKIGTIGESSEIKKSNQQNKIIQQMENRSK